MAGNGKHRIRPTTLAIARALRQQQTRAEQKLWTHLRAGQLEGSKFRRQRPLGRFVADFCCPACRLIIEIDGDSHAESPEYDAMRTKWMEEQGYRVIRFSNDDVYQRLDAVLETILAECEESGDKS